ncbi:MAG TPA: hypothetical protein VFD92_04785 [Candidatus Binatia bacterium]|nr:hypothetical protein [Candidatus Binatia bacterium]
MEDTLGIAPTLNRNLLKWAAGYSITCRHCGSILDCRRTVILTVEHASGNRSENVMCAACADKLTPGDALAKVGARIVETVDGRELFKRSRPARRAEG